MSPYKFKKHGIRYEENGQYRCYIAIVDVRNDFFDVRSVLAESEEEGRRAAGVYGEVVGFVSLATFLETIGSDAKEPTNPPSGMPVLPDRNGLYN